MDHKGIISKYLKEKSNEDEVLALLQEQKALANSKTRSLLLNDEYLSLLIKLARNSTRKIKYPAIIILSNIESVMEAKNFYELCKIAAECSNDKDGNLRQASFILTKSLNAIMRILPIIKKNASKTEINLFYESFRALFYKLHFLFYTERSQSARKSILKSLEIILPKFYDMAKFGDDKEDISTANKIKDELDKGRYGNRD